MTATEPQPPAPRPPAAAPAPPRRSGFYVSPWLVVALGGIGLLGVGFAIGRLVDRRDHGARHLFRGGGGRGLGLLLVLVVLALVITGIVLLVRHFTGEPRSTAATAEQVLADRFARGEIDEAEYVSRRNALRS